MGEKRVYNKKIRRLKNTNETKGENENRRTEGGNKRSN